MKTEKIISRINNLFEELESKDPSVFYEEAFKLKNEIEGTIEEEIEIMKTKQELKTYLTWAPRNEEEAVEYLKYFLDYIKLNYSGFTYAGECITLSHLNILSGIAENTAYIPIFEIFNICDYNTISYVEAINYIEELKDFIEDILEEREKE